jgi:8-amino-7-oxononanoate synthase
MFPEKLQLKLQHRALVGNLRSLKAVTGLIDFSSNDYLGLASMLVVKPSSIHGATGSRLITGHSELHAAVEERIAAFHQMPAALLFNSGYDANLGVIPAMTDRNDLIIYDEFAHASIRDGIRLSLAKAVKFKHNDLQHLQELLIKFTQNQSSDIYIVTESVFSMDGDMPDLVALVALVEKFERVHIILDEAHAVGVIGIKGEGLAQHLGLQDAFTARIVTYGKALGSHGAAVLGSQELKSYLVNFARSFIYTTALPAHALNCIAAGYELLESGQAPIALLQQRIQTYKEIVVQVGLVGSNEVDGYRFRESELHNKRYSTAIHTVIIPGNARVKLVAQQMQEGGYDLRAIVSPTVPEGKERLRVCLHAFNTSVHIENMLTLLAKTTRSL